MTAVKIGLGSLTCLNNGKACFDQMGTDCDLLLQNLISRVLVTAVYAVSNVQTLCQDKQHAAYIQAQQSVVVSHTQQHPCRQTLLMTSE